MVVHAKGRLAVVAGQIGAVLQVAALAAKIDQLPIELKAK